MDREMIVLEMDVKDRASYGFMAMPTPDQYAKKVNQMMIIKNDSLEIVTKESELINTMMYHDISKVIVSMCTRIVSSAGFGGGLRTTVHMDVDIIMNNDLIVKYEIVRPDSFDIFLKALHEANVVIEDPIGIEAIYKQIEGAGARNKYLTGNFGKFKRKYKLEHPRTTKKAN
jgi:hypothetical protein